MPDRQQMVFRSPDWEDGYGGDLLTDPPPARTAWFDPEDRDGIVAMLIECARDTIAHVGWGEFENEAADPTDPELSPIWRKTPRMGSRWAGHVWDACIVNDDGSLHTRLRLTVRCVEWLLDGVPANTHNLESSDWSRLRPCIPPDIEDGYYSLTHAWDLKRPVVLYVCDDWQEVRAAGDRALAPDDRNAIEKALTAEAAKAIGEWEAEFVDVPVGMRPDSHFGRWLAARQQHSEQVLDWHQIFDDDEILEAARAVYKVADVPEVLPSKWAGWTWEAWGDEPGDEHRYWEFAGALYLRLTIRDVVWREGRVARLVYDLEPKLRSRQKACVQDIPTASVPSPLAPNMSPVTV